MGPPGAHADGLRGSARGVTGALGGLVAGGQPQRSKGGNGDGLIGMMKAFVWNETQPKYNCRFEKYGVSSGDGGTGSTRAISVAGLLLGSGAADPPRAARAGDAHRGAEREGVDNRVEYRGARFLMRSQACKQRLVILLQSERHGLQPIVHVGLRRAAEAAGRSRHQQWCRLRSGLGGRAACGRGPGGGKGGRMRNQTPGVAVCEH